MSPEVLLFILITVFAVVSKIIYWIEDSESYTINGVDFNQIPDVPWLRQVEWVREQLKDQGRLGSNKQAIACIRAFEMKFPESDLVNA